MSQEEKKKTKQRSYKFLVKECDRSEMYPAQH